MSATTPNTTPVKKTMTWNEETDKQLIMAIMAQFDYKYDSAIVASKFGPWCTPRAVEERAKKLKKQAKAENHPTSPLAPGQSTKTEAKMQAERAAAIEAFHNYSAEKKAATQAAVAAAAQNTPTKAPKATPASAKATPASRAKKGTATPIKKGKGKVTEVADEYESMAEASNAAMSSTKKRKFAHPANDDTEDAESDDATFSKKLAREAEKTVGNGAFLN
ncbi:hypothetical protein OEA41_009381 [Lepraria neglecta]|uniref:Uncharacterized protein n=1 Tax=Lepraria neglecta TaxID=209136 RepID=A0AAD9Z1X0_9LECA|nr:hypothetical protein OEA41_009381 [Lepraria neglecta]